MLRLSLLSLLVFALAACGGPPRDNPLLNDVRTAYGRVETDPNAVQYAPVALAEAREALDRAEMVWRQKEDLEVVNHYAYLAQQRVRIAEETARLNAAERTIEQARTERQQVLIEARAAEARAAEQAAQRAQQQAAAERQAAATERERAEAALAEARQLAQRVNELEAELTSRGLVLTLGDVLFNTGQATLQPGAERTVAGLVAFLNDYPERNVLIEGHTDNVGSDATNITLSERRANAVRDALTARGISPTRIRTRGYGEAYPVASNNDAAGRQRNRRVEVVISDPQGNIPERTP